MDEGRLFRRGEVIYREGDSAEFVFFVVSGIVSLVTSRGSETVEICQIGAQQIFGEEGLTHHDVWTATAVACNDAQVLRMSVGEAKECFASLSEPGKKWMNAWLLRLKRNESDLRQLKLDSTASPCPVERLCKLYSVIAITAQYIGERKAKKEPAPLTVSWPVFKKYVQRTFQESPVRVEQAVYILVKLGLAELEYMPHETDPDAPDELGRVHFSQIDDVVRFADFCRARRYSKRPVAVDPLFVSILKEVEKWNKSGRVDFDPMLGAKRAA